MTVYVRLEQLVLAGIDFFNLRQPFVPQKLGQAVVNYRIDHVS